MNETTSINGNKRRIPSSGIRYPMFDLDDAVKVITIVYKMGGGKLDLTTLAQAMNYSPSTIRHHVNSAKYYGLIVQEKDIITNTELAKGIYMPISNEEKIRSIQNAFFSCKIYSDLFDRFKDARVPDESILSNIVHREFKVSATGKDVLAKNFISSLKFAHLAKEKDGELIIHLNEEGTIARADETYNFPQQTEEQKSLVTKEEDLSIGGPKIQTVNLILSEGRNAKLMVPGNLSEKEAERLKKQIDILVMEE